MPLAVRPSLLVVLLLAALPLVADDGPPGKAPLPAGGSKSARSAKAPRKHKEPPQITPEREAAALTFVRKNHAELEKLLRYLRENRPDDYRRAIYELWRTSERLAQFQDRGDAERYALELKRWQAQSRIQLLVAQLKMDDRPELREQLKDALHEQIRVRALLLQRDRDKMAERLRKLDEQIRRLAQDQEKQVEHQMRLLLGSAKRAGKGAASGVRKSKRGSDKPRKRASKKGSPG